MLQRGDEVMLRIEHKYSDRLFKVVDINWSWRGKRIKKPYLVRLVGGARELRFHEKDLIPEAESRLLDSLKGI
jgi:hypothetical protein